MLLGLVMGQAIAQRTKVTMNDNWRFLKQDVEAASAAAFDDRSWKAINLPHSYNTQDAFDNEKGYYEGPAWYRKTFKFTPIAGQRYVIMFEGANKQADVWLNDVKLGQHQGGYTAFGFDITKFLKEGVNTLSVRVDNSSALEIVPLQADFTFYGGIYRDVWLITTPSVHFSSLEPVPTGLVLSKYKVDSINGKVNITVPLINDADQSAKVEVAVNMLDATGKVVATTKKVQSVKKLGTATFSADLGLANPKLWSPSSPYLYQVEAVLTDVKTKQILDRIRQPLGWRWYRFDPNDGFFLNGKPLKLIGACRHQDRAGVGPEMTDAMHVQDMEELKQMGGNFVRISHYPQDPSLLDACDRLGLIAWEEIPIVNKINVSQAFTNSCMSQMRDMISQHRNHPSIVIWGYMNEVLIRLPAKDAQEAYLKEVVKLAKKLDSLARATDPERYTAQAFHHSEVYNQCGLADVPQIAGWNLYHGWYHDKFEDFGKRLDKEHATYPKRVHIISEYGAGYDVRCHSAKPNIYDFTAQWGQAYHESYYKQINDRPYIAGASLWNLVDFGSEGRKETMPHINNKGMMTMDRRKKDVYYFYQAVLTPKTNPIIHIAERDRPFRKVTFMTGYKVTKQRIKVYSNQDEIEIASNDKTQGKFKVTNGTVEADIVIKPGVNKIVAWGMVGNNQVISDEFELYVEATPENFANQLIPFREVALNAGSNVDYHDPLTNQVWEADRPYVKGNGGYLGGKVFMNWARIGSQDEITGTDAQPIFQTRRDSVDAYRFDVPAGRYEVELCWAETDPKTKNVLYDLGGAQQAGSNGTEREFSVWANGVGIIQSLNLVRDYGFNKAVTKRFEVLTVGDEGLEIRLSATKGKTMLSGIRVRKL